MAEITEESDIANMALRRLIYIYRMDTKYLELDTSNFRDTVQYFVDVCSLCLQDEEDAQEPLEAFLTLSQKLDGEHMTEFHALLNASLESVHHMLVDSKGLGTDPLQTAFDTLECLDTALKSGLEILVQYHGLQDDALAKMIKVHTASNMVPPKEVVAKSEQYQIVG